MAEACRALHISRAGYYQRRSGKAGARTVKNRHRAGLIKQIHNESPDKGYRCIQDDLARNSKCFLRNTLCLVLRNFKDPGRQLQQTGSNHDDCCPFVLL